jgi:hypothetical protein
VAPMLQVIGAALLLVAVVLVFDVAGAGKAVIRNLTSRSLGRLAPGFAASPFGFKIYAALLGSIGLTLFGLDMARTDALPGLVAMIAGVTGFVLLSVFAIVGEVRTYRELKR